MIGLATLAERRLRRVDLDDVVVGVDEISLLVANGTLAVDHKPLGIVPGGVLAKTFGGDLAKHCVEITNAQREMRVARVDLVRAPERAVGVDDEMYFGLAEVKPRACGMERRPVDLPESQDIPVERDSAIEVAHDQRDMVKTGRTHCRNLSKEIQHTSAFQPIGQNSVPPGALWQGCAGADGLSSKCLTGTTDLNLQPQPTAMTPNRPLPGFDPVHLPAAARIVVAMSGGVDSSVAAGLLKEAGYGVVGITLQLYDHGEASGRNGACCAGRDIGDARKVAAHLGIPHYVLDYEERFRKAVIDDFAASYIAGETPVPCVQCNQKVKFRDLLATARELGASALATGHYVRSLMGPSGFELRQPVDGARDQSWFLFATKRDELEFLRFPLGGMTKAEVREHGRRLGILVADKADSQDICFVPKGHYSTVINTLRPGASGPGEIVHQDGRVIGRHEGIAHYTIGQRKGLGVGALAPQAEPLFVVALDAARARVVVGPRAALACHQLPLRDVNWLGEGPIPAAGVEIAARIRSSGAPAPARLMLVDGEPAVKFLGAQFGVSPGQACVFYENASGGARVLGGGWIKAAERVAVAAE